MGQNANLSMTKMRLNKAYTFHLILNKIILLICNLLVRRWLQMNDRLLANASNKTELADICSILPYCVYN